MKDIAVEAGVTTSTVSLVFRRKPEVSAATRDRILQIAKRLGYRTDPYVSTLMTNRRKGILPASSPVLAFASAYPKPGDWRNHSPTFVSYFEGARARAAEKGFRLETFWLGKGGALGMRASEVLYNRNISGVLLAPLPDNMSSLQLDWDRFHAVALGFSLRAPILNRVASDHLQSVTLAVTRCHQLGYRRVGIVLTHANHERVDRRWLAAFLMVQERLPEMEPIQPLLIHEWDNRMFDAWLKREKPDAVLAHYSGDMIHQRLIASGRRVPEDIGLVDLNSPSRKSSGSGVFEDPLRLGARGMDLLIGGLDRNEQGLPQQRTTLLLDGVWVPGKTLRNDLETWANPASELARERMAGNRRVSMRDIALRAGVNPATVSLTFQNSPRISDSTRNRVHAAADELGYRKNPYLSELMKSRRSGHLPVKQPVLGFVTTFSTRDGWWKASPLFYRYFLGARRRARELGFQLKEFWLTNPALGSNPGEKLRQQGMQGLIFAPLPTIGMPVQLEWEHFYVVALGFTLTTPPLFRVSSDTYSSMLRVIQKCHALGYRRVGFTLSTDSDTRVQYRWTSAYLMHQRDNPEGMVPHYQLLEQWTEGAVRMWIEKEQPDVILATSTEEIRGWLANWGYRVPQDIGLVSLNRDKRDQWVSGVDQNGELIGSRAINALVGLIERNENGIPNQPNSLLIDGSWKPGKSTRRISRPTGSTI